MRRHYVYYRVAELNLGAAIAAAKSLQLALGAETPALRCELLRRPSVGADGLVGLVTLMEIYTATDGGIDDSRAASIEEHAALALQAWIVGSRHIETFDSVD